MKNIHLLPTEKPSKLFKDGEKLKLDIESYGVNNQHIYITSDEEIKIDDYYLGNDNHIYCLVTTVNSNGKKIILTTDPDLIADGIQSIDDEFLEWFAQNPSCEIAHVVYDRDIITHGLQTTKYGGYRIIIPQKESKQETLKAAMYILQNSTYGAMGKVCDEESKQETLEEAALSFLPRSEVDNDTDFITGFEFGAKWQSERVDREIEEAAANLADPNICKTDNWIAGAKYQAERMYSEEEVKRILMKTGNYTKISLDSWFEQFKKK